jgi:glycosyltransferase involved in cell wall biosynthesis
VGDRVLMMEFGGRGGVADYTQRLVGALVAAGVRVVHTPHNTFERGSPRERSRTLMYRLASRLIVHARADLPRLPPRLLARTSVIPIPEYGWMAAMAAPADRAEVRAQLGLPADAMVFLLFGQMRADKGVDDLVAALRAVPGAYAILAGEEAGAGSALEVARADPALRDRVRVIPGFQSIDDTGRWFAAADAAVIPYRVASQSAVLLLAYAFRRPVVAYPTGGLPEVVVDGETGWLCERADVPALAEALREVAAAGPDEAARRGAAGDAFARRELSAEAVARRTIETYAAARAR